MDVSKNLSRQLKNVGTSSIAQKIFFAALVVLGVVGGWLYSSSFLAWVIRLISNAQVEPAIGTSTKIAFAMLCGLLGAFVAGFLVRIGKRITKRWDDMDQPDKVTIFVGLFLGLLVTSPLITFLSQITTERVVLALLVLGIALGSAAIAIYALQTMSDVLPWYRGKSRSRRTGIKILDTNVIIDGRIYDVARAGFLEGQLYVPGFVLEELQYIADSQEPLRRQRGRRGLEVLRHLQADFPLEARTHDRLAPDQGDGVDGRLVRLARALGGDLVTNDQPLNRVASLQEVKVLNLNDLALSLRPNVLPQEKLTISILREGSQLGQGVGYLEDGTMVIVENGKNFIGETSEVLVTQVIQTERGKLIFAEVEGEPLPEVSRRRATTRKQI